MQITTPQGDRPKPNLSPWGVPWPSADDLQRDADTAWAVEVGFADPGAFDVDTFADLDPGAFGVDTVAFSEPAESDAAMPGRVLDELERQVRERHRATAAEYRLIRLLLDRAAADPVPWVGPDPTLDLAWSDMRGRTVAAVRRDRRDVAERAAIAEIATRLRLSEQTVRARAAQAEVLQTRCPDVWGAFTEGNISERHAVEAARLATSLPDAEDTPVAEPVASPDEAGLIAGDVELVGDDRDAGEHGSPSDSAAAEVRCDSPPSEHASWRVFDEGALDRALRLPPARFAVAARSLRERVHSESLEARHRRAARDRGVWLTPELDGMATLSALLPADRAHDAMARVDRAARHVRAAPDEDRTLAQLRADVLADLLTATPTSTMTEAPAASTAPGSAGPAAVGPAAVRPAAERRAATGPRKPRTHVLAGSPPRRPAAIVVTVPALSLLGASTEPAVLDGYGPIDLDTARRLAGEASSWIRVLTHPVTGVPLALDRTTYRVPVALRRWLGVIAPTCVFPGCGRTARECDLDHLTAWLDGGGTDDDNLAPECRHHHRLRHESRWHPSRDPDTGDLHWASPLGAEIAEDPPPF
ncbi:hypothetical protein QE410_002092 [Microbacterium sp. SORGH_AS 1204]|uniref:HNH endonuclease signature motif containing protein n=1 Tax=Microbacterium sp. SORGH_AS_1204 TaxID=3041785 RepID=UPI00278FBFB8|nr:HNH endonuclease signature motif containing protein [Microbacterium sp. SORGH_AS_1204]MDQ1137293.1 hypothetical protein [Microbacterium sp. SORGH_AS_1204]